MPLFILLPLIAQAADLSRDGIPGLNLPQIDRPAHPRRRGVMFDVPTPPSRLKSCLDAASASPASGEASARDWLKEADKASLAAAQAGLCLGTALSLREEWAGAEQALTAAHAAASESVLRAQIDALSGHAALAQGEAQRALGTLEMARGDAAMAGSSTLSGSIALDRARALVALGREKDAAEALSEARAAMPEDGQAWLLSATLSRRMGDLGTAQTQIENAARLAPADGDTGVEAGVIAMLAGHEDAARKSWQSVVQSAPETEAGKRAAAYLAQIGPAAAPAPAPAPAAKPQAAAIGHKSAKTPVRKPR